MYPSSNTDDWYSTMDTLHSSTVRIVDVSSTSHTSLLRGIDHRRCLFADWCAEASTATWDTEPIADVHWVDYPVKQSVMDPVDERRWWSSSNTHEYSTMDASRSACVRAAATLHTHLRRAIVDFSAQAGGHGGRR
jgi:hypothetical protein